MHPNQKVPPVQEWYAGLLLGIVTIILVTANVLWLVRDTRPVPAGDENTIMARTLIFVDRLNTDGFSWDMIDQLSHYGRPPLYQLLSVPFVLIFGRSMDSGVYVNMLFYILLMVATYNIGKAAHGRQAGLLAAILVGTYPTMVRISHLYRPSFALAACTALTMWQLLLLVKTRSVKCAWWTSLSLAFGLLVQPMFAYGIPIPAAAIYVYLTLTDPAGGRLTSVRELFGWLGRKLKQPLFLKGILPSGLIAVGLVSLWYLTRGDWMISTLLKYSSSDIVELRGFETLTLGLREDYPALLMYALTSPSAISIVFGLLAGIGLIHAFIRRSMPGLILAGSFLFSYLILSLMPTLGWRYFDEILPIAAVLTSLWIFSLRSKKLVIVLVVISLGFASLNFILTTSELIPASKQLVSSLGGIPADSRDCDMAAYALFCPDPPRGDPWPVSDVLEVVSKDADCREITDGTFCGLLVVSTNPYFQFPVYKFHQIQDFPDLPLEIEGVLRPLLNVNHLMEFEFIIYQDIPTKGTGWYNKALLDVLQSTNTLFSESHQRIMELNLPDGTQAVLVKRITPLTYSEAEEVLSIMKIPDPEIRSYEEITILTPLAINENMTEKATQLCQKTTKFAKTSTLLDIFDQNLYSDLGWVHYLCGNMDAAKAAYNQALEIYEFDAHSHYGLALIYLSKNQIDKARQEFELAIQSDPNSPYASMAGEWLDQNK